MKESKLYKYILKLINGENIEEFNLGANSKHILNNIKKMLETNKDDTFKKKLLNSHKITLSIAHRMLLDEQSERLIEQIRNETNKKPMIIHGCDKLDQALELLKDVYLESEDALLTDIKHINIELLSESHAKRQKIKDMDKSFSVTKKFNKSLYSIDAKIIKKCKTIIDEK